MINSGFACVGLRLIQSGSACHLMVVSVGKLCALFDDWL